MNFRVAVSAPDASLCSKVAVTTTGLRPEAVLVVNFEATVVIVTLVLLDRYPKWQTGKAGRQLAR